MAAQLTQRTEINFTDRKDEIELRKLYDDGKVFRGMVLNRSGQKELVYSVRDVSEGILSGIWVVRQEGNIAAQTKYQPQDYSGFEGFSRIYLGRCENQSYFISQLREAGIWGETA